MMSPSTPNICTVTANGFTKCIASGCAAFNLVFVNQNKNTVEKKKRKEILLQTNKEECVDKIAGNWLTLILLTWRIWWAPNNASKCLFCPLSVGDRLKARLHGSPRLINTVESMKLNSTVERYGLHGSTKVKEAVDFKMAANELVREGAVVICDYLIKECQHILEKKKQKEKTTLVG